MAYAYLGLLFHELCVRAGRKRTLFMRQNCAVVCTCSMSSHVRFCAYIHLLERISIGYGQFCAKLNQLCALMVIERTPACP